MNAPSPGMVIKNNVNEKWYYYYSLFKSTLNQQIGKENFFNFQFVKKHKKSLTFIKISSLTAGNN